MDLVLLELVVGRQQVDRNPNRQESKVAKYQSADNLSQRGVTRRPMGLVQSEAEAAGSEVREKAEARSFSGSVGPESHCEECGFYSGCDGNPR